jgi:hypothetical protein
MKYCSKQSVKLFELYLQDSDEEKFIIAPKFKQDIRDMFVELEDEGYEVDIDYLDKGK